MRAATTFSIHEALALDPTHPLIPFAFAGIEMRKSDAELPNSARAVWLIADGSKRLPDDTSADDLRLAARYVAFVARTIPETKAIALALLDRAAKLTSENDETKALRAELVK